MTGFSSSASKVGSSVSCISELSSLAGADFACSVRSEPSSDMSLSLPEANRHPCRRFGRFHLEFGNPGAWGDLAQALVNGGVEEFTAPGRAARLGDRNLAVLHVQMFNDARDEAGQ